jgi:hypothetical protein
MDLAVYKQQLEARHQAITNHIQESQVEIHRVEGEYRLVELLLAEQPSVISEPPTVEQAPKRHRPSFLKLLPEPEEEEEEVNENCLLYSEDGEA